MGRANQNFLCQNVNQLQRQEGRSCVTVGLRVLVIGVIPLAVTVKSPPMKSGSTDVVQRHAIRGEFAYAKVILLFHSRARTTLPVDWHADCLNIKSVKTRFPYSISMYNSHHESCILESENGNFVFGFFWR